MTELSLFYNHQAFKDTLILVADESSYPTTIEKYDDVVVLKNKENIVGINIFNSLNFIKIKANGLVHLLNEEFKKCIETIIKDYTGYDVKLVENTFLLGRVEEVKKDLYLVDIGKDLPVLASSLVPNLKIGEYVEVAWKETRLTTGHKAYHYLHGKADYLISANDLQEDVCGTILYKMK